MTMAKALTNGNLPMGAVAVDERIYDTITGAAPDGAIDFFHGYTYSGTPAACAAGLATMEIYEREGLFERAAELSPYFLDAIFSLRDLDVVTDLRGYGLIAGFDLVPGSTPGVRGPEVQKKLFAAGLHLKMTGDSGIVAPRAGERALARGRAGGGLARSPGEDLAAQTHRFAPSAPRRREKGMKMPRIESAAVNRRGAVASPKFPG